jgi:hypothetical protein
MATLLKQLGLMPSAQCTRMTSPEHRVVGWTACDLELMAAIRSGSPQTGEGLRF